MGFIYYVEFVVPKFYKKNNWIILHLYNIKCRSLQFYIAIRCEYSEPSYTYSLQYPEEEKQTSTETTSKFPHE